MNAYENDELELELTGRTLRVYWYMLQNRRPLGRTEVRKGTKLSSVSLAEYHLKKLVELGLVEQNSFGDYYVCKTVQLGVMRFYLVFMSNLIPRFVLYTTFYATIFIAVLLYFNSIPLSFQILILSILIFGILTSLLETVILWKSSPGQ